MIIRAATAADCVGLAAADSRSNPSPWSENQFRSALDERFTTVLIAECGGKTAGFIVWQSVCGESELHLVATDPPYRRQGVAAQLLAQWFQTAFSEHAERLFLEVRAKPVPQIRFRRMRTAQKLLSPARRRVRRRRADDARPV